MPDTSTTRPVRWGVLGTAGIAAVQFLPALAEAGGVAVSVGGRDGDRARDFATANGVARGVEGYRRVLDDPEVEAVYVPLPNPLHAEWAAAALRAGKAVLCEKPMTTSPAGTQGLLDVAASAPQPLWEAFVFPFQAQHLRIVELLESGVIGELREIVASYHFRLSQPGNIRLSAELFGGALADVGCYGLRLAHELYGSPAVDAAITAQPAEEGLGGEVEAEAAGTVTYADGRRLLLTCGFRRAGDTTALLLGTEGSIRVDNPYHPKPGAALEVRRDGADPVTERPTTDAYSFTAALRHVHAVVRDGAEPRQLASGSALAVASALALTQQAAGLVAAA